MSIYVKDNEGNVHRVGENTKVTREQLVETFKKAEELLQRANQEIIEFDALVAEPTPDPDPETPAEQAEEIAEDAAELAKDLKEEESPKAPETPAPTPATEQPAPEKPVEPVASVTPEAPVAPPVAETQATDAPAADQDGTSQSPVPQPQEIVVQ